MTDESKFPPDVLEQFRHEQEESDAHFTTAPARFFEAWKQAVMLAGPVYFGDGTSEAVENAKDKWALAPNGAVIPMPSVFSAAASGPSLPRCIRSTTRTIVFFFGRKRGSGASPTCRGWTLFTAS
ncbi:hypothetical protein J2794_005771 [Paraburkholderia terricola]|uniref:hypothetical protein n=1 Tax=Paraburkholderia terricola TaxID=169427 RepID=UPI00285CDA76|nr:hypothetical protein [Paraburkholderia terricola]MDR6449633.1 hypothetical protein [Paraburkholderia terricola]